MSERHHQLGFSFLEVLVSLALLSFIMAGLATLIVQSSRINKAQQMRAETQSAARTTLALVTQALRSAGWDPAESGFASVTLDPNPADAIDTLDVFADLNGDGDRSDLGESLTIRHSGDRVEWRRRPADPFETVGTSLTNDADGDGTREPMFTADASPNPTRILVRVTARSPAPESVSGDYFRYTVSNTVLLRNSP